MSERSAWGYGLATITDGGQVLDTWFPSPALGVRPENASAPEGLDALARADERRSVRTEVRVVEIDLDAAPASTSDAYLRLHLLSARLVRPRTINLDGIFAVLPNNAWTSLGPVPPEDVDRVRLRALEAGIRLSVFGVDKFPG